MNVNKANLFENKSLFISHVNAILSTKDIDLTISAPHNVSAGRGYSKTLVNIDVCKVGQWTAIFTFDMSNYSLKRTNTLGKYSKAETENIISEAYNAVNAIIDGFHELDGTNEMKRQEAQKEADKQAYINDMTAELANELLYDETIYTNFTVESFFNDFISRHNITCEDTKDIVLSRINRRFKRYNKENNITVNAQPVEQTEATNNSEINNNDTNSTVNDTFIVGNRSFSSYSEAVSYCLQSDFDPSINIQEVAPMQPSNVQTSDIQTSEPITYHFYKQTFNNYMDAYNHAINNRSPVTMILPSNHPYMNNERLQQLEHEYVFSKGNMSITDMKEYFDYILSLPISTDQQERYYKLQSYIQRYEYKQQQRQHAEQERQRLSLEGSRLLVFMKEKGLELELTKDKQWYYFKGKHVYSFYSCSVEKYHADMLKLFNTYFAEYADEYNNSKIYYYKGNKNTTIDNDSYPIGWISYNHTTNIATFNRPLTATEQKYYSLTSIHSEALQAV